MRHNAALEGRTEIQVSRQPHFSRLAVGAAMLALVTFVPTASAQDEPAFVFPCADGVEWAAEPAQPIAFLCGWGTVGGPGLIRMFLKAHDATLVIEDENGDVVLAIGRAEFASFWGNPESGPSGFEDVTCAAPTGHAVAWSYVLEAGLPGGTYTVTLEESLRHPVTDGFQTCWADDGTRLAEPPNHLFGGATAIGTIVVND
jgi:hypothetical protein